MKDLSLHILDLVHNSVTAKASRIEISIHENPKDNRYTLKVEDNGKGIAPDKLPGVIDPYTTSRKTRKVGMGLPLLKHNAVQAGGNLEITSTCQKVTKVTADFQFDHIDRPPPGDLAGVIIQLFNAFSAIRFRYVHETLSGKFIFDTDEVRDALGEIPTDNPEIRKYLREMITENLHEIGADR